ncbi:MAG TPA: DUF6491 family protein [Allosphingosinicella sp.]|nr:DUF6491 family protein [Allosphingosinicella sp.]
MKRMLALLAVLSAPALAAAPSGPATPPPADEEVSIPFAHFGGIYNFDAPSDDLVYLQDRGRNWYRARLYGQCWGLQDAIGIGIDTRGSANFDRTSLLIVDHQSCPIESLTRSGPPPKKHHGK